MSHDDRELDARLARLSEATSGITPRAGFGSRVMARIAQEQPSTLFALGAPARRFFPLGMLAAALALFWAVSVDNQVDETLAAGADTELVW
jgi:hypothetical protein